MGLSLVIAVFPPPNVTKVQLFSSTIILILRTFILWLKWMVPKPWGQKNLFNESRLLTMFIQDITTVTMVYLIVKYYTIQSDVPIKRSPFAASTHTIKMVKLSAEVKTSLKVLESPSFMRQTVGQRPLMYLFCQRLDIITSISATIFQHNIFLIQKLIASTLRKNS